MVDDFVVTVVLLAYGGRSFSIWSDDGTQVFDSGSDFERITALRFGADFNNDNAESAGDSRSDNKGPEPEAVAIGEFAGRTFAFIGLERIGGVMVYDISNPQAARFVQYLNRRDFSVDIEELDDASAADDACEWLHGWAEIGLATMIFVPDDLSELITVSDNIAD